MSGRVIASNVAEMKRGLFDSGRNSTVVDFTAAGFGSLATSLIEFRQVANGEEAFPSVDPDIQNNMLTVAHAEDLGTIYMVVIDSSTVPTVSNL